MNNPLPVKFVLDPKLNFEKLVQPPAERPTQKYKVRGYAGGGHESSTFQGRAGNCFYAVNEVVEESVKCLGKGFNWSKTQSLDVSPEAGVKWNAYYNRRGLYFFHNFDNVNCREVYMSSAAKIVFHESGHAVLDAIRPDMWSVTNFEVWAFHEAFGDLMAFFCTMRNPELLDIQDKRVWTGIGVEMSAGLNGYVDGGYTPLRDLSQRFDYVNPSNLPKSASANILSAGPHSFSRVLSSAVYRLFSKIRERLINKGGAPVDSTALAADTVGRYLVTAASLCVVREFFFDSVCRAMIYVDWREGYPYMDLMHEVFGEQGLLQPKDVAAQAMGEYESSGSYATLKLSDETIGVQSSNPLRDLKVVVGLAGNTDRDAIIRDVALCLDHLHDNGEVNRPDSSFAAWKGNLIRRHFSCCFDR